jgi:hypothetical protein
MQNIADSITQLPVDDIPLSTNEMEIMDTLFKQDKKKYVKVVHELKDALLVSILVFLFCLVNLTPIIFKFSPYIAENQYLVAASKGLLAGFIFYILQNMELLKK